MAAEAMGFPECHTLYSVGNATRVSECPSKRVKFKLVDMHCGAQPKCKNFTIGLDGKTLKSYSPCYWKNKIVNFEGSLYKYLGGQYRKLKRNHSEISLCCWNSQLCYSEHPVSSPDAAVYSSAARHLCTTRWPTTRRATSMSLPLAATP